MTGWFDGVFKDLALEFLKWVAVGIVTWLASKLPGIRRRLKRLDLRAGAVFWIAAAIAFAGFASSAVSILYTSQRFQALAHYGSEPQNTPDININGGTGPVTPTCPDGYYVVGAKFTGNSAPPYCIGCFVAAQLTCRKIVK
ncbi:hypothetical protein [Bradyrhizobium campsiandrae]|uniref:Uncharacterized protein n=1 Tax=Bradyrhizobium campsiandrae TaxID=1729892 RepID=A0ABR7U048_9BRAD|nr:hypothetical protein [Bradyrhizobium campsiandrae]MBC9976802.1 hypothetical protein [Bradyrhizobium campsiandrae]